MSGKYVHLVHLCNYLFDLCFWYLCTPSLCMLGFQASGFRKQKILFSYFVFLSHAWLSLSPTDKCSVSFWLCWNWNVPVTIHTHKYTHTHTQADVVKRNWEKHFCWLLFSSFLVIIWERVKKVQAPREMGCGGAEQEVRSRKCCWHLRHGNSYKQQKKTGKKLSQINSEQWWRWQRWWRHRQRQQQLRWEYEQWQELPPPPK